MTFRDEEKNLSSFWNNFILLIDKYIADNNIGQNGITSF